MGDRQEFFVICTAVVVELNSTNEFMLSMLVRLCSPGVPRFLTNGFVEIPSNIPSRTVDGQRGSCLTTDWSG